MRWNGIVAIVVWFAETVASASETWNVLSVVEPGDVGTHNDVVVDSVGNIHVVYRNIGALRLEYRRCDASTHTWSDAEVVDTDSTMSNRGVYAHLIFIEPTAGSVTLYVAYQVIQANGKGMPRVAERINAGTDFVVNGETWSHRDLTDGSNDTGYDMGLAMDGANNLHVCWYDKTATDLEYITGPFSTIHTASAAPVDGDGGSNDLGRGCSLAIDGDGYPHIVYYDVTNSNLLHVCKTAATGGSWTTPRIIRSSAEPAVLSGITFSTVGLCFDSSDNLHAVYYRNLAGSGEVAPCGLYEGRAYHVRVPKNNSSSGTTDWSDSTISYEAFNTETYTGVYADLAYDSANNELWACFFKFAGPTTATSGSGLRVFRKIATSGSWTQESPTTDAYHGESCRVYFGGPSGSQKVYITFLDIYGDDGNRDLWLATNDASVLPGPQGTIEKNGCRLSNTTPLGNVEWLIVFAFLLLMALRRKTA